MFEYIIFEFYHYFLLGNFFRFVKANAAVFSLLCSFIYLCKKSLYLNVTHTNSDLDRGEVEDQHR